MKLKLFCKDNYIELNYNKNSNNKYKVMDKEYYDLKKIIYVLINSCIEEKMTIELENIKKTFDINKIKLLNIIYVFLASEISFNVFNEEISLYILEILVDNNILIEEDVEVRFFYMNINEIDYKTTDEKINRFTLKLNDIKITTDFMKVLKEEEGLSISFYSEFLNDLKLNIGNIINISSERNKRNINKKVIISTWYYDETNKCYFIRGKEIE
ncbi:MAG: hypothetical protein ACLT40_09265 [Fusobacterium sp.]